MWSIAAFFILLFLPGGISGWMKLDSAGWTVGDDYVVKGVDPGSSADLAGVRAGDRLGAPGGGLSYPNWLRFRYASASVPFTVPVTHNGTTRIVTVQSKPLRDMAPSLKGKILRLLAWFATSLMIVMGAFVVIAHPGIMSFAAWYFCIGTVQCLNVAAGWKWLPDWIFIPLASALQLLFTDLPTFALVLFALAYPVNRVTGLRARIACPVYAVVAGAFVYYAWMEYAAHETYGFSSQETIVLAGAALLAIAILSIAYFETGADRERLTWGVAAFALALGATLAQYAFDAVNNFYAADITNTALLLATVACLTYAMLTRRLFDLTWTINRVVVLTVMGAALIVLVEAVHWGVEVLVEQRFLSESASAVVKLVLAVAIGTALHGAHEKLDERMKSLIFKDLLAEERRLNELADRLETERTYTREQIHDVLVHEVRDVLTVASSALFLRAPDGGYDLALAEHWEGRRTRFEPDHPLVRRLAQGGPVCRPQVADSAAAAHEIAVPDVVVPISYRQVLLGMVLYGAHCNGTRVDPDEMRALERVARAAAIAFDDADAKAVRDVVTDLERQIAELEKTAAG